MLFARFGIFRVALRAFDLRESVFNFFGDVFFKLPSDASLTALAGDVPSQLVDFVWHFLFCLGGFVLFSLFGTSYD